MYSDTQTSVIRDPALEPGDVSVYRWILTVPAAETPRHQSYQLAVEHHRIARVALTGTPANAHGAKHTLSHGVPDTLIKVLTVIEVNNNHVLLDDMR